MLNTLDVVIAFAVIMTVLSLLITILVQMVSAALSLRGKNLANALSLTFQTIDPRIGDQAHSLAAQILRDPIFSDSIWRNKSRKIVAVADAATQVLIDAEKKLKQAQQALARNTDETKKQNLEAAVKGEEAAVATAKPAATVPEVKPNRMSPWSFWAMPWGGAAHLGNAIRPGEIYRILNEFGELTETEAALRDIPPTLVKTASDLIEGLRKIDLPAIESQGKLRVIGKVSEFFTNAAQQQAVVDSLANFGATVERATTQAYDRFQRWFGSAQDRAEQWFQTHMRIVTIVMAILTAFLLQLDTVEMYRALRNQPKLVEALVKSAPNVLEEGGTVLDPANTPSYYSYLLWLQQHPLFPLNALPTPGDKDAYKKALGERLKAAPDADYPVRQFDSAFDLAQKVEGFPDNSPGAAAKAAYSEWLKKFPTYKLDPEPDFEKATKESIRTAIQNEIKADAGANKAPDQAVASKWLDEYDGLHQAGVMAYEKARQATFTNLRKELDEAGFDLAPTPLLGRWAGEPVPPWASKLRPGFAHFLVHFLGMAMTAGLLALGAPFWFNLLKNLMSLRPAVAALIEKRPTSAPALPASPKTPPTSS